MRRMMGAGTSDLARMVNQSLADDENVHGPFRTRMN